MKKSKKKTQDLNSDRSHYVDAESKIHALINRHINNKNHKISREEYLNLMNLSPLSSEEKLLRGAAFS